VETVLVRVNDRIMTVNDFKERLELELSQGPPLPSVDALEDFARGLFGSLVDEMVLLERAQEKRLKVDDQMVDNAIENLREENDLRDDQAFEEALQSSGMTEDQLRDRYRHSMLIQRTAQSEVSPTEITEQELIQRYEKDKDDRYRVPKMVELEQVFFPIASDGSDAAQVLQRARGLIDRVRNGNDLKAEATLAGVEAQELGAIPEGDLRPDLKAAIDDLDVNEITDPIEMSGGFQVIRVMARIPAGYQPFEEVRESIRREVSMESYEQQTRGVVDRLKSEYLVEIDEEGLSQIISSLASMV
jgi:parvulin-like peptidyl-prolyl isomerase